jgi:hypothetical protein
MAFRQYTQCVDIANFDRTNPYVQAALVGLYVTLTPAGFTAFLAIQHAASVRCLWLLLEIYAMAFIDGSSVFPPRTIRPIAQAITSPSDC